MMAAVEQFLRDTAPPPADEAAPSPWVEAARREAVDRRPNTSKYPNPDPDLVLWRDAPGLPREPGGPRGRPGSRHPHPPARVRRLRQRGREVPRRRARAENEFIGFRLKQGVYGQRQADVQMIRVKLPLGGVTPDQMETFADVVEKYAPLNKGHITTRQNIQIHHVPLRDAAALIREISDAGLSSREGCGNTVRNVTADPWAGVCHDELFDATPYAGAYVRYFVRHPTTQLMPRKVKTAFTGSDTDRALTGIHDVAFIARERDGVKGFELRIGGGTSIMPRDRAHAGRLRARRRRRVPQVHRGRPAHLRPPGLAARQPRPRPAQGAGRQGRHRGGARAWSRRSSRATGSPSATSTPSRASSCTTRRPTRPRSRTRYGSPNGDGTEFLRFRDGERRAAAPGGLQRRPGARSRAATSRPSSSAAWPTIMREFRGGYARTTVHQNFVLRWVRDEAVYDVWQRLTELGLGDAGADQVNDVVSCPGTDSLQARHHQLDGPQPRRHRADRGDEHHRSADPRHPHQDVRLPQRLQPAPHRQHRVLRRLDQGRRAHDPRLRRPHRRQLRGRRDRLRRAAEGAPAGQARARGGRALDPQVRGRARGRRGVQRLRRRASAPRSSRTRSATSPCRSSSAWTR